MPDRQLTPTPPHEAIFEPLSPAEIVKRLRDKLLLTPEQIAELGDAAYTLAWSVANATSVAVLQAMRESLAVAIQEGQTLGQWKEGLGDLVESFTSGHLETIFRTTLATAYESERFDVLTQDEFVEYLVFDAVNDDRVRPEHLALDGMAWKRDEFPPEFWPPLPWDPWNCRCSVFPADFAELKSLDAKEVTGRYPAGEDGQSITPPPGFAGSAPSMRGLSDQVRADLQTRAVKWGWGADPIVPPPPKE